MSSTSCKVRVTHRYEASAEQVFDAWIDPKHAGLWLFATTAGQMVRVEIDARVGGQFMFIDRRHGEEVEHCGEYLELDRPRRLEFTFAVPKYSAVYTRVAIDIRRAGAGCELTLVHEGVLPEYEAQTQKGWETILGCLAGASAARGFIAVTGCRSAEQPTTVVAAVCCAAECNGGDGGAARQLGL